MRDILIALVVMSLPLFQVTFAADFNVSIEKHRPYPLWLPPPGASVPGIALPAAAEKARQEALAAVKTQNWKAAIDGFEKARRIAPCAPSLIYNLALAYEKDGKKTLAALWYRVYLSQQPDAPNATVVRAEIARLTDQSMVLVRQVFDEAEKLAGKLSATPLGKGLKSQQQQALEGVAWQAFSAGLMDRGNSIIEKIRALPESLPLGQALENERRKYGIFAAERSVDVLRANAIQKRWGYEMDPNILGEKMASIYAKRGDIAEAQKWIETVTGDFWARSLWRDMTADDLERAGAFEAAAMVYARSMDASTKLDESLIVFANLKMEKIYWEGRPDVARDLARNVRRYAERFAAQGLPDEVRQELLKTYAILGDSAAIEASLRDTRPLPVDRFAYPHDILSRVAMILAANAAPAESIATIDHLMAYWNAYKKRDLKDLQKIFPRAFFARAVLLGQVDTALKIYDSANFDALSFAVATGRDDLAFAIIDRSNYNQLESLHRMSLRSSSNAETRGRFNAAANNACQGWRPRNAAQANAVNWRLKIAGLNSNTEYNTSGAPERLIGSDDPFTDHVDWAAKNSPEKLPDYLAYEGGKIYLRVLAAQVEDEHEVDQQQVDETSNNRSANVVEQPGIASTAASSKPEASNQKKKKGSTKSKSVNSTNSTKPSRNKEYLYQGQKITLTPERTFDITDQIDSAKVEKDDYGHFNVTVCLKDSAAKSLEIFTKNNIDQLVGLVLRFKLVSYGRVHAYISGGCFDITAGYSKEEASRLKLELIGK